VAAAVEHFGGVDVCINNASAIGTEPTEEPLVQEVRPDARQINIRGTFLLTKACLPHLRKSPNGHVVTIAHDLNLNPALAGAHRRTPCPSTA